MITNLSIRQVENGYFVDYWKPDEKGTSKSHQRVFYTWQELCDWLKEQVNK
jgi:hypothetical protein